MSLAVIWFDIPREGISILPHTHKCKTNVAIHEIKLLVISLLKLAIKY